MTTERYALEHPGEWGESRLLARATFLEAILRHRPNVIQDLWRTVLPEFKRAVATRYCSQITEGLDLEEYQREKEAEFVENPQICGDYIVALLQHKLTLREAGGQESLRHEFFSFHKIDTANRRGREVGRFSLKPGAVGFTNAEKLPAEIQQAVTEYATAKWGADAVATGIPGSAYAEKFFARNSTKIFTGLIVAQLAVDVARQYADSHYRGYYQDFFGQLFVTDISLAAANLPRGTQLQFNGILFINTGHSWLSADPACFMCKLEKDEKGNPRIVGGKRCCD